MKLEITAESLQNNVHIDEAILNDEDPRDFWKKETPYATIISLRILLEIKAKDLSRGDYDTFEVDEGEFHQFMEILRKKVAEDQLVGFVRNEFKDMQGYIETCLQEELEDKMS